MQSVGMTVKASKQACTSTNRPPHTLYSKDKNKQHFQNKKVAIQNYSAMSAKKNDIKQDDNS